ncbi:hypothetical protein D187_009498 [Cystobacter fuscus DSM 2262]|uniref:Uncharacterized protein n=1 Tax=Cystobacter fuscus (strain ATCC 25194 / DSM 2262 / NBRC 100088 / M29) TaxID=1242864 RepID=S9Q1V9_CYSF2|nr:hypothetical protein D187_009498 [Cystobacter fuscus DSM 2262]
MNQFLASDESSKSSDTCSGLAAFVFPALERLPVVASPFEEEVRHRPPLDHRSKEGG